ncbi:MAG: phytanoyl-CoA dioxygenase family protein [Gaiellaceae bacterium]
MDTAYHDSAVDDVERRRRLYDGQIFVFGPRPSTLALVEHARHMIEEAFDGIDPQQAQYEMCVERYVEICAPLKPAFIHNDTTKDLVRDVLSDLGCDLERTYQDVPRLRMVTSHGYLTSGVGYAHHPHRDTWYAAPMCQLNWWLPIYDIESESSMAFHPRYWTGSVKNGSNEFNYYEWNSTGRKDAAKHIASDTRKQPKPEEEMELDPQIRFVPPAGGIVLFSAAQMHSTVPNTSGRARYSIDFRTVHLDDVESFNGAPNVDSAPRGTSLRDFKRASDHADMSEEVVAPYDDRDAHVGELVYRPEA